jgi:hypothetical protein
VSPLFTAFLSAICGEQIDVSSGDASLTSRWEQVGAGRWALRLIFFV